MFNKLKGAIYNVVGNLDPQTDGKAPRNASADSPYHPKSPSSHLERGPPLKFRYTRPHFLQLTTDDEIQVSADHIIRPIIVPRDMSKLPWSSGYAETINAGKSIRNEDQAAVYRGLLRAVVSLDAVAGKVADMMPTVPGHPRQVPIARAQDQIAENTVFSPKNSQINGKASQSEIVDQIDGVKISATTKETIANLNEENIIPDVIKSSESSLHSNKEEPLSECIPVSPNDLSSPSTPLPIHDIISSPTHSNSITKTIGTADTRKGSFDEESLPWIYFGIFDGHAGSGVAVAAANTLHKIIQEKLQSIGDLLIAFGLNETENEVEIDKSETELKKFKNNSLNHSQKTMNGSIVINHDNHLPDTNIALLFHPATDKIVTIDSLIIGALESSFWDMDNLIAMDKYSYRMSGGCTALAAIFILGKLYIANAGDSRCIMYKDGSIIPMSFDFTPESERERIKQLGLIRPELLGHDFTHLEFVRRPARRDLGKKLLYRDAYMTGWTYKTITIEDLKFPLIYGEGKRSRVLATIGVTRGLGDHELKAQNSDVDIKPFLTAQPEVRVVNLENETELTDSDVIILGTDGLWDITTNEKAVEIVQKSLDHFPANDTQRFKYRYISAAQDLVMHSRGKSKEKGKGWKTIDNKTATIDDISVFVIPLKPYRQEYLKWKEARNLVMKNEREKSVTN